MIFNKVILTAVLWAQLATPAFCQEITFRVFGVQGKTLTQARVLYRPGTLGEFTHGVLEQALSRAALSEYRGSDAGVLSINGLGSAMEVLSDTRMNAYGWCYRVDGVIRDELADELTLTQKTASIDWFYAYASLDKDRWTAMCVPADHLPTQE